MILNCTNVFGNCVSINWMEACLKWEVLKNYRLSNWYDLKLNYKIFYIMLKELVWKKVIKYCDCLVIQINNVPLWYNLKVMNLGLVHHDY